MSRIFGFLTYIEMERKAEKRIKKGEDERVIINETINHRLSVCKVGNFYIFFYRFGV